MKKFKYSFILVFILLFNIKDLTYAQGDIGVGNLRNFYTKHDYIDLKGVTDKNLPIANQLEFSTGTNDLISESNNWDEISKFKGKKLDIFGIDYNGPCKSKYMYGGATLSGQYLNSARKIPINLWVNGKHKTISTDKIATNKKQVTAQEIDVKLRRYLQEEYNIYGHNKTNKGREYGNESKFNSGFDKGNVIFHLNNGTQFSYDLFYTGHGQPEDFLKVYNDNKTIDSENFHLDVDLSLSKTI
ncbi:exotoxin beta-grasp domain-containing protein [Staphylococcus aureus]|uniref:exotoxin beta-grasp domain-containing protein n=1 Tax=Staphylococcus aureus TaxID=1280 RepID=UPI000DE1A964|nr:exotoxin beta-grasp domain-containing protein [Staphylococcus aureus]